MTAHNPIIDLARAGAFKFCDTHCGVLIGMPAKPNAFVERGPGRPGTTPNKPIAKPVHGGYPEANSHKLDPREYQPVSFPAPKKPARFSIVRNDR